MKKNRIDSFTCFVGFLLILALFFSIKLFLGIQDGKKQYSALVSLGDLTYDDDFLKKAKKIEGIKEIWPVVEIPVTIKIEDYTETATFLGIDLNAFGENPEQNDLGNTPVLLLGSKSLQNMKDSNNHSISKKQQEKFLQMGENLTISYALSENTNLNLVMSASNISATTTLINCDKTVPASKPTVSDIIPINKVSKNKISDIFLLLIPRVI